MGVQQVHKPPDHLEQCECLMGYDMCPGCCGFFEKILHLLLVLLEFNTGFISMKHFFQNAYFFSFIAVNCSAFVDYITFYLLQ